MIRRETGHAASKMARDLERDPSREATLAGLGPVAAMRRDSSSSWPAQVSHYAQWIGYGFPRLSDAHPTDLSGSELNSLRSSPRQSSTTCTQSLGEGPLRHSPLLGLQHRLAVRMARADRFRPSLLKRASKRHAGRRFPANRSPSGQVPFSRSAARNRTG